MCVLFFFSFSVEVWEVKVSARARKSVYANQPSDSVTRRKQICCIKSSVSSDQEPSKVCIMSATVSLRA